MVTPERESSEPSEPSEVPGSRFPEGRLFLPSVWGTATTALLVGLFELLVLGTLEGGTHDVDVLRLILWSTSGLAGFVAAGGVVLGRSDVEHGERRGAAPQPEAEAADRLPSEVLDQMSEGVIVLDVDGRVVLANRAAARLLGMRALPVGLPMRVLARVPRLRTTVVEALRSGEAVERTLDVPRGTASSLLARAVPIDSEGGGVVLALLDVSAIRRMEGRWKRFAADAAHELRTPIAAVSSNLEVLSMLSENREDDPGRRYLDGAVRQSDRMVELVEKLMQLVRMDGPGSVLDADEVPVGSVLDQVVEEWMGVDAGTADRIEVDDDGAVVVGDRWALLQVVQNLTSNALRYSAGPVTLRCRTEGSSVRLEVEDRGPGIPEDFREAVFERFVRVDDGRAREAGGTGLGLSIVRELVEGMGGAVRAESAEPHGTVMKVELPHASGTLDEAPAPT